MGINYLHDENDENYERFAQRLINERPKVKVYVGSEAYTDFVKEIQQQDNGEYLALLRIEPITVPIHLLEIF